MRLLKILFLYFLLGLFVTCRNAPTLLTTEDVKKEIREWWGAKIFEGVVIEDTIRAGKRYEVYARMVVCFDTLQRMKYEFKKFKRGWKITKGPVTEDVRKLCIQEFVKSRMTLARETVLKVNMRNLQSGLEIYAAESGSYPAYIVTEDLGIKKGMRERLGCNGKNPYLPEELAYIDARSDTSEWFLEYIGKVVYFPWVNEDGTASKYIIRGSKSTGFIELILGL